jgi:hypothetical protein
VSSRCSTEEAVLGEQGQLAQVLLDTETGNKDVAGHGQQHI